MSAALADALGKLDAFMSKGKKDGIGADDVTDQDGFNKDPLSRIPAGGLPKGEAQPLVADAKHRSELATARHRADAVYSAFSQSPPPPWAGEDVVAYRRRLIRPPLCS